jgi:eukaryotic-like serine/threonine-protein kinase
MTDRIGQQLGNYQLIRLLGEGGFAEVYLGEHIHLGTQATIKLLHTQLISDDVDKFRTEARTIARLLHPNIVRVLEFGIEGKTPFLVMDYAPKGTLRQLHPKGQILPLPTVISYVKQIAEALQCAHDEKLVHRDVKPENMLVGRRGEILLSDFGIALVAQSSRYQSTQDMTGTIAYMAPEQIQGKPRPASDQYSLGITVYEWLTGDRPFHGGFIEIVAQHITAPVPSMCDRVSTLPHDVEHVIMTALEKDHTKRFGNVSAFAKALEHAAQPQDIQLGVKPPTRMIEPTVEAKSITPPKAPMPQEKRPITPPSPPVKPIVREKAGTVVHTYLGHSDKINALAWSSDSRFIASGSADKTVKMWGGTRGSIATYRGHWGEVNALAWAPDNLHIASASDDRTVKVWNTATNTILYSYLTTSEWHVWVYTVAWSLDGKRIASGGMDTKVRVWNAYTPGENMFIYHGHSSTVNRVTWSPDSTYLASGSQNGTVQVWNASTGHQVWLAHARSGGVLALAWSPDGKLIASGGENDDIVIWDATTGRQVFISNPFR